MKDLRFLKISLGALMLCFAFAVSVNAQRRHSLDQGWKFHRGAVMNAEMMECDDSNWRTLTVPHDFSMDAVFDTLDYRQKNPSWKDVQVGPFSRLSIGDWDTGQTVGGEGWYRKTFSLPILGSASVDTYLQQTSVSLRFDGVYNQAEVWVNGKKVAMNVYGYMPFDVNLSDILKDKAMRNPENERRVNVVVKATNEGLNSRWYAGSGMFRHVWLITSDKLHLDEWDVFVDGSEVVPKQGGNVKIFAKVHNDGMQEAVGQMVVDIMDAEGNKVASVTKPFRAPGTVNDNYDSKGESVETEVMVKTPHLWSVDDPYRYTARVSVQKNGEERDALTIPFGIRTIKFSADKGFELNGKPVKLRGGCVHHDNGLLGAAGIDRADVRKVELMKAQGYNAVRCSHNLPTEAFLNACDSLGMLVIDEVFDQWEEAKRAADYSHYFSKEKLMIKDGKIVGMGVTNFEHDAALMVRRDRNHPSIIMWGIGNEIAQRADAPRGKELALAINLAINNEDGTRPTTIANNSFWDRPNFKWETDSYRAFENVEVGGYNYEWRHYESDHEAYPHRIMYGSESFPKEMAENWNLVDKHDYILGDFVWTAIDYVGEAGLGHTLERTDNRWVQFMSWPWFNAWCGDLDITGVKKPQSMYRDVLWGRKKIAMAVRPSVTEGEYEDVNLWCWTAEENHWNWDGKYLPVDLRPENYETTNVKGVVRHNPQGNRSDSLRVNVYSRESRVRLLLNDSIMGEQEVDPLNYTASFTIAYEPGELKAEVVSAGKSRKTSASPQDKSKEMENDNEVSLVTAGAPSGIVFEAVDSVITASHNDLAYIYINIVDDEGRLCPTAEIPLSISTSGVKHVATAGTGHPYDMKSFRSLTPTTFRGRALLIIQPQDEKGEVLVKVSGKGIKGSEYVVEMK